MTIVGVVADAVLLLPFLVVVVARFVLEHLLLVETKNLMTEFLLGVAS